jgi:hypothetical protein
VQYKQGNYVKDKFTFGLVLGGLLVLAPASGFAAQSILDGPKPNPCADNPDYVPGIDANGQPVAGADEGARPVPVPGQILVPLTQRQAQRGPQRDAQRGAQRGGRAGGDPAYTVLDGKRLEPLVNPTAVPCPARN